MSAENVRVGEWTATVTSGAGKATGEFHERAKLQHWAEIGYVPVPGTLNLNCPKTTRVAIRQLPTSVRWDGPERLVDHAKVFYPVTINGVACHVRVLATHIEAIAPVRLRDHLVLTEGQTVTVSAPKTSVSVAVMAHPKREQWVPGILDKLDAKATVVWDRINDRHETGLRAIQAYDPSATHHLIVQDDALLCRDLVAGVSKAVEVSGEHPLGLYTGRVRPNRDQVAANVAATRTAGRPWFAKEGPWWGVGIVLPTAHISELSAWFAESSVPNYDRRIARWYGQLGIDCWYTMPSLVEHRTENNPSLTNRPGQRRCAHWFIGEDASALDVDWQGEPLSTQQSQPMAVVQVTFCHVRTGERKTIDRDSTMARKLRRNRLWAEVINA